MRKALELSGADLSHGSTVDMDSAVAVHLLLWTASRTEVGLMLDARKHDISALKFWTAQMLMRSPTNVNWVGSMPFLSVKETEYVLYCKTQRFRGNFS
jgi:hypothetical protein